jgi:hypothetical protein
MPVLLVGRATLFAYFAFFASAGVAARLACGLRAGGKFTLE